MQYKKFPNNFLELTDPQSNYEKSKAAILPVPYEKTTTFLEGTKKGPKAMLEASVGVQLYDEELNEDICNIGICTLQPLEAEEKPEIMLDKIYDKVKKLIDDKKFPVIVGGEHTISPGCVRAFAEKYEDLSILWLDAHLDLEDDYDGDKYSHACAGKRCFDIIKKIVPIGIRSVCKEEVEFSEKNNIKIFWAKDIVDNDEWFDDAMSKLSENVYITIDLDGFDPSFMPSVGNPEPGGLQYYPALRFLKKVCKERNVVGFDVVELCPNEKEISSDFTAAKLIYKLIGYAFYIKQKN